MEHLKFDESATIAKLIGKFASHLKQTISPKIPQMIGIAGGSGSGKTFVANFIKESFENFGVKASVISQDSYYKGGTSDTNYDVPEAIDFDLLVEHIIKLQNGCEIDMPQYDFKTHSRKKETIKTSPDKLSCWKEF